MSICTKYWEIYLFIAPGYFNQFHILKKFEKLRLNTYLPSYFFFFKNFLEHTVGSKLPNNKPKNVLSKFWVPTIWVELLVDPSSPAKEDSIFKACQSLLLSALHPHFWGNAKTSFAKLDFVMSQTITIVVVIWILDCNLYF